MKKLIYLIALVTCCSFLISANKKENFNPKKIGLQHVGNTNLWVDANEVSVLDYEEMMYSVNNGNYTPVLTKDELFVDTKGIEKNLCSELKDKSKIPLLGISRAQAEEYCRFRSWAISRVFGKNLPKQTFRLITEEEAKSVKSPDNNSGNCIGAINQKPKSIIDFTSNADEWLAGGKAIVNGKIVNDNEVNISRTGFRCCLEY